MQGPVSLQKHQLIDTITSVDASLMNQRWRHRMAQPAVSGLAGMLLGGFIGVCALLWLMWQATFTSSSPVELTSDWHGYWQRPSVISSTGLSLRNPLVSTQNINRDVSSLHPQFQKKLGQLLEQLYAQRYEFILLEGLRSADRQSELFAQGPRVTQAPPNQSKHQYGLAADLAPLKDGVPMLDLRDPWVWEAYQALGKASERLELTWGGRWSMGDYGHIEVPGPLSAIIR